MTCPSCGAATHILETRSAEGGAAVRRRRECKDCGRRFTSFERREREPAWVLKRDGGRQRFNAEKLRGALARATHKREDHVSPADLDAIVDRIEFEVEAAGGELASDRVRELCLDGLSRVDAGAQMQFAGTLPEDARNPRNHRSSDGGKFVRAEEEAKRPTTGERARGDRR